MDLGLRVAELPSRTDPLTPPLTPFACPQCATSNPAEMMLISQRGWPNPIKSTSSNSVSFGPVVTFSVSFQKYASGGEVGYDGSPPFRIFPSLVVILLGTVYSFCIRRYPPFNTLPFNTPPYIFSKRFRTGCWGTVAH